MKVLSKKSFKLPFIGKDKFVQLTRTGLGYEGGSFFIKNYNNLEKVIDTISEILGENVSFSQTCLLCGRDFLCSDCKHHDHCTTRDLPLQCICKNCRVTPQLYDRYVKRNLSQEEPTESTNPMRAQHKD